ncbi:MAG: 23S rRNA (adenine(2030)-N(6))-methyltransferase RlmJ [Gammaproteobacteria bacterium]|nr:23S rRNA (adenine(2030)-N(6))-methyltransferase RlmJ [Gammaproteobacteria bacterium]
MLSYRHAFHAGNFADVLKHAVLVRLFESLTRKETPLFYLDTHAGAGRYDLENTRAARLREWRDGIGRLWTETDPPESLAAYLRLVREGNAGTEGRPRRYPGSPWLVRRLLRPGDRMVLCELHPTDHPALRECFAGDRQVAVHHRDGYEALKAFLPPPERRGLVLLDPAYELPEEWERLADALVTAWRRWPTGMLAAWLPLLAARAEARLYRAVETAGLRKVLRIELRVRPADSPTRMNGSALLVVNPPWQLDQELAQSLPWLLARLAPEGGGSVRVDWLATE